jgi:peptidoglycan/LPS O-acetylase OafA/YrhL
LPNSGSEVRLPGQFQSSTFRPRLNLSELEQNRGRRLIYLESIRGIAALCVVFGHLAVTFISAMNSIDLIRSKLPILLRVLLASPLSLLTNGRFAVRIFFVLSGFVLSLSYFHKKTGGAVSGPAARRYPRLMLPALASVMFGWILLKLGWYWNIDAAALMQQRPDDWLFHWFLLDRTFTDALREGTYGTFFSFDWNRTLNSSLWTMPWELGGSLIVFSLLALFGSAQRRLIICGLVAIGFYAIEWPLLVDFVAGLALCDLFVRYEHRLREKPIWPVIALFAGLVLGGLLGEWPTKQKGFNGYFVNCWPAVPAVLIIGGITFSPWLRRGLEGRAMAFLGKISFPLYLFHLSIICSAGCGLYVCLRHMALSHGLSAIISTVVCISFLLLLSWLLYFILELPSLRVARRIGRWVIHREDDAHVR